MACQLIAFDIYASQSNLLAIEFVDSLQSILDCDTSPISCRYLDSGLEPNLDSLETGVGEWYTYIEVLYRFERSVHFPRQANRGALVLVRAE